VNAHDEIWFWGVSFLLTNRKSCSHAPSLDAARPIRADPRHPAGVCGGAAAELAVNVP
jgi:hypothetical protein